ncbi:iron reductase domain protein [Parathielavia appendiculata]|uniref:Iron reductase domain protein n=1 Tax=Parathielavia appendiculata TaxID=2587402 RepID=A0AAN6UBS3_9PEZI|nr:iron reductase domain protein [Parathielavia appendiculata]
MEAPDRSDEGPIGEFYKVLAVDPRCPKGKISLGGVASCAIKQRMWLPTTEPFRPPPSFSVQQVITVHSAWPFRTEGSPSAVEPPVYYFPLADAFLPPERCIEGLFRLLCHHLHYRSEKEWLVSAACCFACPNPTANNLFAINVTPLPAEIYTVMKTVYHGAINNCFPKMRDLVPGTWAVLIHADLIRPVNPNLSRPPRVCQNFFQCAFVRPKHRVIKAEPQMVDSLVSDDLEVLDLQGFVRAAAPSISREQLNSRVEWLEACGKCHFVGADSDNRPRFSLAPVDAETACGWLRQALARLRTVRNSYQEICYLEYSWGASVPVFRIAIPDSAKTNTPFDTLLQIVSPVSLGWAGFSWGGGMTLNPLTVVWPNGNGATVSSRWATGRALPTVYSGATYRTVSASRNATHWTVETVCSGCSRWSGGAGLSTTDVNTFAWAVSRTAVSQSGNSGSSFAIHNNVGMFSETLEIAKVPRAVFDAYVRGER